MPVVMLGRLWSALFVYPIPATEVLDPGVQVGSKEIVSSPLMANVDEGGALKSTLPPSSVSAAGNVRVRGATTYCNIRWLPLAMAAREVISRACTPVDSVFRRTPSKN